ncbi:Structural maintenance of chromosomes protein 6, partial [Chytriomyces hyalinus]
TENEIKSIDKVVLDLRMSEKDRILAFRPQTRNVFYAISQMQWNETPIGPLGLYLNLTDNTYQLPIEVLLGKYLHAFIVSNREDEVNLKSIMTRENCKDMVIRRDAVDLDFESAAFISKLPCYSHNNSQESRGPLKTMFTELRNPSTIPMDSAKRRTQNLVLQQLVIFCKIEKRCLVATKHEGDRLLSSNEFVLPPGVEIHTKDNAIIGGRGGGLQTRAGAERLQGTPVLATDVRREIRNQEEAASEVRREIRRQKAALDELEESISELSGSKDSFTKQERRHNRQVDELSLEIESLEDNLKENESGSVGIYEEQKKKLNDDLHIYSAQLETLQNLKADQKEKLQDCRNEIAAENKCKSQIEREISDHTEQLKEMQAEVKDLSADLAGRRAVCEAHHDRFVALQEQVSALKIALDADTIKAQQLVPRITVDETVAHLTTAIRTMETRLNEIRKMFVALIVVGEGDEEVVKATVKRKKALYDIAVGEKRINEKIIDALKAAWNQRQREFIEMRTRITTKACHSFTMLMHTRGFKGKLVINHDAVPNPSLTLSVGALDLTSNDFRNQDPSTISGGEKSLSTVCFLLSLWESAESPFRALDEFDVFMDSVNRTLTLKNIIEHSRTSACRQYIFISPQDTSTKGFEGLDILVQKMRDPVRNQQTLNFGRSSHF